MDNRSALDRATTLSTFAALLAVLLVSPGARAGKCESDKDCKGDRICENGKCVAPTSSTASSAGGGAQSSSAAEASLVQQALAQTSNDKLGASVLEDCQGDAKQCHDLASAIENGHFGFSKSPAMALALYQHGCDAGDLHGCDSVVSMVRTSVSGVAQDFPRARKVAKSACGQGSAESCRALWYDPMGASREEVQQGLSGLLALCQGGAARQAEQACLNICIFERDKTAAHVKAAAAQLQQKCSSNPAVCSDLENCQ